MTLPIDVPLISSEPVASVLRILNLVPLREDVFEAHSLPQVRRVYGGQVIAQSLLAAAATIEDPARLPHSLHCYFLRGGDPSAPFELSVARLRDGRSFSNRRVVATQDEREIFSMIASFQVSEPGLKFTAEVPDVPGPEKLNSALELFRTMEHPVAKFLGKTAAFDVRHVQQSLYTGPDPSRSADQQLWMKIRSQVPDGTPQIAHRALLAYVIDQVMLEPALRTTGLSWMTPGLSLASLDHAMWFHADVDINDWLLFSGHADAVGGGRGKTHITVYSSEGKVVATASQEGMMRVADPEAIAGSRWGFSS
ncbi:acyl-CoA thioesterase [Actinomyces minihominis]|uniref:acyl-CoA thioesterase n=1 Tax=Actinomyces minihominis TaxID=2002838 RepID=UPI000C077AFD|nr:acyl-CoA thioesterase domain-containing protein [Actinomyces minihominis]